MNNIYKRADLLGISVYELVKNYIFIFDIEGKFYGITSQEDIDKYIITHNKYSDSILLIDLLSSVDNLQVLTYDYLEEVLENNIA